MEVTISNYADLFSLDYLYSLVKGLEIGEDGINVDGPVCQRAKAWIEKQGEGYTCDKVTTGMILEEIAGFQTHSN